MMIFLNSHPQIGLTASQFKQFCDSEEGDALVQEVFGERGYHAILVGDTGTQNSLYTVNTITSLSDISGLKGRVIGPLGSFFQSIGAITTSDNSDPSLQFGEFINPGIDSVYASWFETMNHRYKLDIEEHTAYFLIVRLEVWNELSYAQKTALERECAIAHDAMLRNIVKEENTWKSQNPTHRLVEHKQLPDDIQASYDAYTLAELNSFLDPLPDDHVAKRLKDKLLEFKTVSDIESADFRLDSTVIQTSQLDTRTTNVETTTSSLITKNAFYVTT